MFMFENETTKRAIKRLHKKGYKKLFLVNCYITDTRRMASTMIWSIYANIEDAKRWPKLCKDYQREHSHEFADGTSYFDDEYECVYSYSLTKDSPVILERFKITVV